MTDYDYQPFVSPIAENWEQNARKRSFKAASRAFSITFFSLLVPTLIYVGIVALFKHDPLDDKNGYIPPKNCMVVQTQQKDDGTCVVEIPVQDGCVRLDQTIKKGQYFQLISATPVDLNLPEISTDKYRNLHPSAYSHLGAQFVSGKKLKDTTYTSMCNVVRNFRERPLSEIGNYGALVVILDDHSTSLDIGNCLMAEARQPIYMGVNVNPTGSDVYLQGYFRVEFKILKQYCG